MDFIFYQLGFMLHCLYMFVFVSRLDSNIEREAASEPKHGEYKCGLVTMVDHMRLGWNFAESVSGQRGAVTEMWTVHRTLDTRQALRHKLCLRGKV